MCCRAGLIVMCILGLNLNIVNYLGLVAVLQGVVTGGAHPQQELHILTST